MKESIQILILLQIFIQLIASTCLDGWIEIPEENTCIQMSTADLAHLQALRDCQTKAASLVKITDAFMNAAVAVESMTFVNGRLTLIGVEKMSNGEWAYSDGTPLRYTKWKSGEPNNGYACTAIDPRTALWQTVNCTQLMPYVCGKQDNDAPCDLDWLYSVDTNFCYYLKNFTATDGQHWDLFNFTQAEGECLASTYNLASLTTAGNGDPCNYGQAWIGLSYYKQSELYAWTDNTFVDYIGLPVLEATTNYDYTVMNDVTCNKGWMYRPTVQLAARFVCKKKPSA
ncbi:unnamed protein product, partial [Mesorhabditis belari]|uniref:C-type lectin domain-containing protein n=1 Tax=Mesorhabditis belari TaxID=2138241 RepID=A0AAF3EP84_9BILA